MELEQTKTKADKIKLPADFTFSASSIKSYFHCGLKFKYEKLLRLEAPPETSHYRWLGKLVHASIYQSLATFNTKDEAIKRWDITEDEPDVARARKFFLEAWKGEPDKPADDAHPFLKYMHALYPFEIGKKPVGRFFPKKAFALLNHPAINQTQLEAGWKTVASGMVETGVHVITEQIHKITQLEYELRFMVEGKPFRGFIDILALDKDGKVCFYDFKTSWAKQSQKEMDKDLQFILYSYALKQLLKLDYYPVGHLIHLKSGGLATLTLTDEILQPALRKIRKAFEDIDQDIYFDDMGGRLCNYCDFYSLCYSKNKVKNDN